MIDNDTRNRLFGSCLDQKNIKGFLSLNLSPIFEIFGGLLLTSVFVCVLFYIYICINTTIGIPGLLRFIKYSYIYCLLNAVTSLK